MNGRNLRLENLRKMFREQSLESFLISDPVNIRYISGFTGSNAFILVSPKKNLLLTDFRYWEQADREITPEFELVRSEQGLLTNLKTIIESMKIKKLGFESEHLNYLTYETLKKLLPRGVSLKPSAGLVRKLRQIKDESEIKNIKQACNIADKGFEHIISLLRPGMKERDIASELEYFMKKNGAEKAAFDPIIASGPRAALPHGVATDRIIGENEPVIIDFGARYGSYNSDLTRTVFTGKPSPKFKKIYRLVYDAQKRALEEIRPGRKCWEIDAKARDYLADRGYGKYFGHGLGHGIGLEVHEGPSFSRNDETVLEPGMVLSVEPGIYLSGWGGVRIEDLVLVTGSGCEVLTHAEK